MEHLWRTWTFIQGMNKYFLYDSIYMKFKNRHLAIMITSWDMLLVDWVGIYICVYVYQDGGYNCVMFLKNHCGSAETRLVFMRTQVQFLASLSGLQIPSGCGCGVGWQLYLQFDLWPGNFHIPQVQP